MTAHTSSPRLRTMRRILVDHARKRAAGKRGGGKPQLELDTAFVFSDERSPELLRLDDALTELAENDSRECQIVEMRFFVGLTFKEIAAVLGISERTEPQPEVQFVSALQFMQDNTAVKAFFKGIADLQAGVYAGPEPHPGGGQATDIINALQELDSNG